jgi:release factor glutamine methyltransferase
MEHNVTKHEPHLALFVPNDDPLIFYKAILNCCEKHLRINGKVFMETHENYANDVANLFAEKGYQVEIKKDIFDKNRMVLASRCH